MSSTPIQIRQDEYSAVSLVTRHISSQRITHVSQHRPDDGTLFFYLHVFQTFSEPTGYVITTYSSRIPYVFLTSYQRFTQEFNTFSGRPRLLHTYYERPKNVTLFGFSHVFQTLVPDVKKGRLLNVLRTKGLRHPHVFRTSY